MFTFLLVVLIIVVVALIAVILMQRSEGGGLTSSGNPAGLMSARGAADFLTRATAILATVFVVLAITLAAMATMQRSSTTVDTSLAKRAAPGATPAPTPAVPVPAPAPANSGGVPLAH